MVRSSNPSWKSGKKEKGALLFTRAYIWGGSFLAPPPLFGQPYMRENPYDLGLFDPNWVQS